MRWRRHADPGPTRADRAIEQSQQQLDEVRRQPQPQARWFEDLADRFRHMREANHLAEKFRDALEGR